MPSISTWPEVGVKSPLASFIMVVLPLPLGPSRPTMRPDSTVRFTYGQRLHAAVILGQISAFKYWHLPLPPPYRS
jgi:hypothetical protein